MKSVFFSRYTGSGHINSASALDYRSSNCVTVFQWFRIRPIPIPVPRHVSIFGALYPKLVRLFSRERVSVPYIREKRAKKLPTIAASQFRLPNCTFIANSLRIFQFNWILLLLLCGRFFLTFVRLVCLFGRARARRNISQRGDGDCRMEKHWKTFKYKSIEWVTMFVTVIN